MGGEREAIMTTTTFQYVNIEYSNDYPEYFNESGLIIIWRNPYYKNGKSQLNRWVYPLTNEGMKLATKDAMFINNKIRKEVEETSFMRKGVYN